MDRQQDYVLRTVEERGVRFIRLWFTDVQGFLKSFAITPAELELAFDEGMMFDGSAIDGYSRVQESDMLAVPDAQTFELLPWRSDDVPVARVFCDIHHLDGEPFPGDPRRVLRRNLERAHQRGYTFFAGPEMEYFYFHSADRPEPIDRAGFFDLTPGDVTSNLRRQTILTLEHLGIPVEYSHHEIAPGQQEIDLRYADALSMADSIMTFKLVVKQVAHEQGVHASFMPKPIRGVNGSGMHTHLSLFEGDANAFHDPGDTFGLSKAGKGFVAGLLHHAAEITAVTNQWVNSYKRLVMGYEAPVHVCWARNNQSALVRVPEHKRGKDSSTRVEYRAPDAACNPYLAFSVVLAAGMKGIEEGYELPPEATNNIFEMTPAQRRAQGIRSLPSTLDAALDLMEGSELVAETLGDHLFEHFIRNKRDQCEEYHSYVTAFEIDRLLGAL